MFHHEPQEKGPEVFPVSIPRSHPIQSELADRVEILEKTIYWHPIELMIKAFQDIIDTVSH